MGDDTAKKGIPKFTVWLSRLKESIFNNSAGNEQASNTELCATARQARPSHDIRQFDGVLGISHGSWYALFSTPFPSLPIKLDRCYKIHKICKYKIRPPPENSFSNIFSLIGDNLELTMNVPRWQKYPYRHCLQSCSIASNQFALGWEFASRRFPGNEMLKLMHTAEAKNILIFN